MKTLGRILIILLAAAIVISGASALLQTGAAQALVGQPMSQGDSDGQAGPPDFANGQGGNHGERGGSWEAVIRNLIEMVMIMVAVQVLWSIGRRIKRLAEKNNRLQWSRGS
jgi:hypothetical protein